MRRQTLHMDMLCRDCINLWIDYAGSDSSCPVCRSSRVLTHKELKKLRIAHIDCDAFYAAVEKRDNPILRGKPVIVGGSKRGVVAAACYIARINGVRSAMPMFKAKKCCPDAVIIAPNMGKYIEVGKHLKSLMTRITPLVESLSIDEAFLDLSGTEKLHRMSPAEILVQLELDIENEIGITASIGLSYNKFLSKIASDLNKPRGFSIIGLNDSVDFLQTCGLEKLWGVGKSLQNKLEQDGISSIGDIARLSKKSLIEKYGSIGGKLYNYAHGQDLRPVNPQKEIKNMSSEKTFDINISNTDLLAKELWLLVDKITSRLIQAGLGTTCVSLKVKTQDFKTRTRSITLHSPTQLADDIYAASKILLNKVANGRKFRLIGVNVSKLIDAEFADQPDLADLNKRKRTNMASAIEEVRKKFGYSSIKKGIQIK